MNTKIIEILEKTENFYPDEGVLDSYFNTSEERRNRVAEEINKRVIVINEDRGFANLDDTLDYIISNFDDSMARRMKEIINLTK